MPLDLETQIIVTNIPKGQTFRFHISNRNSTYFGNCHFSQSQSTFTVVVCWSVCKRTL